MPKDFLRLNFAADQIQFQDMIWKTEEWRVSRNIKLEIWQ